MKWFFVVENFKEAKDEFKSQQSVNYIEQEFSN